MRNLIQKYNLIFIPNNLFYLFFIIHFLVGCENIISADCAYVYALPADDQAKDKYHGLVITSIDGKNVRIAPSHKVALGRHSFSAVEYMDIYNDRGEHKSFKTIDLELDPNYSYYLAAKELPESHNQKKNYWAPVLLKRERGPKPWQTSRFQKKCVLSFPPFKGGTLWLRGKEGERCNGM